MAVRRKYIRSLVQKLLEKYILEEPPINVEQLAVQMGVAVQYKSADDKLSGFLLRDLSQHKALIGINADHPPNRQRFSIAHELGHLLLHEGERMHVDHQPFLRIQRRDETSSQGSSVAEKEANLFAAELLMPVRFIERDLAGVELNLFDDEQLSALAQRYEVSTQALTFRLAYLNYIQA